MSNEGFYPSREIAQGEVWYGIKKTSGIVPDFVILGEQRFFDAARFWFKNGLMANSRLVVKKELTEFINKDQVIKHISAIINSFFIDKESKIRIAAQLLSMWCDSVWV